MGRLKIELQRCFVSQIDPAQAYVDYNEFPLDPEEESFDYIQQLFSYNYENVSAKKATYTEDSFIEAVVPADSDSLDAFVDVIVDEMHELLKEAYHLSPGTGLFLYALVEERPVIAFFKLNYQTRYSCKKDKEGKVTLEKDFTLLPSHTQKEYDYFFIQPFERRVWMSDMRCVVGETSINYMADRILKIELKKSEKETVKVIDDAVIRTIKECYPQEAPKKLFQYRQAVAEEVKESGELDPVKLPEKIFEDSSQAKESFTRKVEDQKIPKKAVPVSPKTQRALSKKQKIVTDSGIEILVPVEYLEDKNVFEYRQENGRVSIYIHDINGSLK